MMWVKSAGVAAMLLVAGCTYGPAEERALIENEVVRPDTLQFAVAVRYERFRPATGIAAFPNGGIPKYLEQTIIVHLVDLSTDDIVELARIEAPDQLLSGFSAGLVGWKGETLFLVLSGCPEPGCPIDQRQFRYFALSANAEPRRIGTPPEDIDQSPGMLSRAPGEEVYMRVSADSRMIAVRTDDSEPSIDRYMLQNSGELLEIALNQKAGASKSRPPGEPRPPSERSADKTRSERIKRIEIDEFDHTGFSFSVHISEGAEGSYRLKTSIDDGQAVFLEEAEEIELDSSKTKIIRYVSFEQLFQKCFDEFQGSTVYPCIENTGAKSFFTLESQLIPIKDKPQTISNIRNNVSLTSAGKTEFSVDTFTKDMKVKVNDFRPL